MCIRTFHEIVDIYISQYASYIIFLLLPFAFLLTYSLTFLTYFSIIIKNGIEKIGAHNNKNKKRASKRTGKQAVELSEC